MRNTGKVAWLLVLPLLLMVSAAQAALEASVDRREVALGDVLQLTLTATGNTEVSAVDLRPLQRDFEILQRATKSSVNIINGQRSERRELQLQISPRREGILQIPSLQTGGDRSQVLTIEVGPAPTLPGGEAQVIFEAEVDRPSVYVQGQLLLTLRIQQAISLDARSITELQLDRAFVKPLEQKSYQRTVNGRPWLVHEVRYAIFPEQSGTLEIPPQTFTARERLTRRGLYDLDSGRRLRRSTKALQIEVLPRPERYPAGTTWLPAQSLRIEEQWSTPPEQLRAGESATRTVRITGTGLQGAQLPPVQFRPTPGLKYYPDQPEISEREVSEGLIGERVDSAAVVPTAPGHYRIPEIRIPWWDTETGTLREAILPGRELDVTPAPVGHSPAPLPGTASSAEASATVAGAPASAPPTELWWWRGVALLSALGWLVTLALLLRSRRQDSAAAPPPAPGRSDEPEAFKALQAACAADHPDKARRALVDWGRALFPEVPGLTLGDLSRLADDARLDAELQLLERQLYAADDTDWRGRWQGRELATLTSSLRARLRRRELPRECDSLALYPQAHSPIEAT